MSIFACCFRRHNRQRDESMNVLHEPPEISWENTLGAPTGVPFDDETKELLRACLGAKMPSPATLTEIIKRSENFPVPFPVGNARSFALRDRGVGMDTLEFNANSVYPLIHEATLPLIANWLKYKRIHGSSVERGLYKDMGLVRFVQRLLDKRALQFYGADDRFFLVSGKSGSGGWEHVGTEREKEPLVLASCLSYDEIKLSATIIITSHTEFINDGSRENKGVVTDDPDSIQPRGVIMGVVGTRFEKPRVMEYQDILISHMQNNADNGYGPAEEGASEEKRGLRCVWARFYGEEYHPVYDEAMQRAKSKDNRRYVPLTGQIIFDAENYMKRILMSVEMILLDANTRAEKQNTTAFLHVVGFGLGIWKIIYDQEIYFLKTFEIALRKMNKKLRYVSDIMFSYFRQQKCGGAGNGDYLGDIRIHFALREPQTKLFRSSDANKLLVVTYAADGNSYPGNEFWGNYLTASADPAAACSSQIAELHNPRINPRACGASLHVASPEHGLVHIGDYAKLHLT
ncbi:uncharacterized protein LOC106640682 [Copidosoma floridanum]|uniref:uncharacterized protein LOC106640682 n=1 Tax=Copidosoma floridanum TaxID=29053 RepID=UPI0006C9875E|nr:uncharacterized protein LOC106640682 [Copidosoma floridanum]